jgi:hypothetical protein
MAWCRSARIWSRSGSLLATRRGRRQLATWRTRRCRIRSEIAGRPAARHSRPMVQALGWPSSRRIRLVSVGLPSRGPARAGPVGQPSGAVGVVAVDPAAHARGVVAEQVGDLAGGPAVLGEQDHNQAAADPVVRRACFCGRIGVSCRGRRRSPPRTSRWLGRCGRARLPVPRAACAGPQRLPVLWRVAAVGCGG